MNRLISYTATPGAQENLMALKSFRCTSAISFIFFLLTSLIPLRSAQALNGHLDSMDLPSLRQFANEIKNNQNSELRGVYVPGILAARVVQQPQGHPEFVSTRPDRKSVV